MVSLFDPITVGSITAANRIWMSPLTRGRATEKHVPTPLMGEYYTQRTDAGLIISEGVGVSQQGLGWPYAPGLWTKEQVEAWKPINKAVHENGGKIVAQLWHMGRTGHSNVTHETPVSSSATQYQAEVHTYDGKKPAETARALSIPEIEEVAKDFGRAAKNAIEAGFDGVQIHGANGYLVDQFLRDKENHRTDEYGGSIENRIRFLELVVKETSSAIGSSKTSLRLSPNGEAQGIDDSNAEALFTEVAKMLNKYDLAFLELREASSTDSMIPSDAPKLHDVFRKHYKGTLVLNQAYDRSTAEEALTSGIADAIAFGRAFIANPDLVEKIKHKDDEWTPVNFSPALYGRGPVGYTDYPIKYPAKK